MIYKLYKKVKTLMSIKKTDTRKIESQKELRFTIGII